MLAVIDDSQHRFFLISEPTVPAIIPIGYGLGIFGENGDQRGFGVLPNKHSIQRSATAVSFGYGQVCTHLRCLLSPVDGDIQEDLMAAHAAFRLLGQSGPGEHAT